MVGRTGREHICSWVRLLWIAIATVACGQVDGRRQPNDDRRELGALEGVGRFGLLRFELELEPARPKLGDLFRVVTTVRDASSGEPVEHATVVLDAGMPSHGHGMSTRPEHRELGAGRYLSEGLKFHMPGLWELTASATSGDVEDTINLEYEQPATSR